MEVHAHSHSHGKKNWKTYFWEFLMLFLAVFCGFLAEYQLEHKIEKDREKVYMKNMLDDLKSDTATYGNYGRTNTDLFNIIDSLIYLMKKPDKKLYINKMYFLARTVTLTTAPLFPNERTYDQMKNSGHLRIISKRVVSDNISSYYNSLKFIDFYNDAFRDRISDYLRAVGKVFDAEVLLNILTGKNEQNSPTAHLLTDDIHTINEFLTAAQYLYGAQKLSEKLGMTRSGAAKDLIMLIKKEYHLE